MDLPKKFCDEMKRILGEEYPAYLASMEDTRKYGLRVNTAKISVEDFLKISPFELTPIPYVDNGFYYDPEVAPAKHPYYFAGLYYLQDPSAMTPASRLPVEEGDVVLDLCAAPGGKATELAAKLHGTGLLIANDISSKRAKALLKNIELFGVENSFIVTEYPQKLQEYFTGFFDKILIDAPCSGEGMFRKEPSMVKAWEQNGPEFYAKLQEEICCTLPVHFLLWRMRERWTRFCLWMIPWRSCQCRDMWDFPKEIRHGLTVPGQKSKTASAFSHTN